MVRRRFTVNSLRLAFFFAISGFIMFSWAARAHAQGAARDRFVVTPFVNQSGQR
jgi:hypothetical protein